MDQLQLESHVIAGLDDKGVLRIWDPVLDFSQKKIYKEEQGRSVGATRCGQRLSAVQVRKQQQLSGNVRIHWNKTADSA